MNTVYENIKNTKLQKGQVGICYLGQEGYLFDNGESRLVVDPYLSDYVDQNCCQYVKWERLYEPPVKADELDLCSFVLCTHTHYDHADPITLSAMAENNPDTVFIVPAPEIDVIASYGINNSRIVPAYAFKRIFLDSYEITPIPSAHDVFHRDENGDYRELGYIIKTSGYTFFHAGDMCMYDGLIESLKEHKPDIAFLPINGRDYFREKNDIIGNFNCDEAIILAREIGASTIVPMHHDLYEVNCVSMTEFGCALQRHDPNRSVLTFNPGEIYVWNGEV